MVAVVSDPLGVLFVPFKVAQEARKHSSHEVRITTEVQQNTTLHRVALFRVKQAQNNTAQVRHAPRNFVNNRRSHQHQDGPRESAAENVSRPIHKGPVYALQRARRLRAERIARAHLVGVDDQAKPSRVGALTTLIH